MLKKASETAETRFEISFAINVAQIIFCSCILLRKPLLAAELLLQLISQSKTDEISRIYNKIDQEIETLIMSAAEMLFMNEMSGRAR